MVKRSFIEDADDHLSKRSNRFIALKIPHERRRHYLRSNEISRGAHSTVYKLLDQDEKNTYAGKKFLFDGNKVLKSRIINEIQIYKIICQNNSDDNNSAKNWNHPNIVAFKESFQINEKNDIYMVLDYCNKGSLQSILQFKGTIEENQTKNLILQLCGGLDWLHSNHIVHGDLKLDNLLIHSDSLENNGGDILKICDFGHSFINNGSRNFNDKEFTLFGTPYYLAPEIIYKYKRINHSGMTIPFISFPIDIWSIGIIMFTLLYGHNPFMDLHNGVNDIRDFSLDDLMTRITSNRIKFPRSPGRKQQPISTEAKKLIMKLLRQHPLKRLSLLEIITKRWFQNDFNKDINLLSNGNVANDKERSLHDYFACLKKCRFIRGEIKDNDSEIILNRIKRLHKKGQRIKKQRVFDINQLIQLPTLRLVNEISIKFSNQIISNEFEIILTNLFKIETGKDDSIYTGSPSDRTASRLILIQQHKIIDDQVALFSYKLTNEQFGTILKHGHSILFNDVKNLFWYICPDKKWGWVSKCFSQEITDKLPRSMVERLEYVNDYKIDMDLMNSDNELSMILNNYASATSNNDNDGTDVFLRKVMIYKNDIDNNGIEIELDTNDIEVFYLSDGTIQFNFIKESYIVAIRYFGRELVFINPFGHLEVCEYKDLVSNTIAHDISHADKNYIFDKLVLMKEIIKRQITGQVN